MVDYLYSYMCFCPFDLLAYAILFYYCFDSIKFSHLQQKRKKKRALTSKTIILKDYCQTLNIVQN